MSDAGPRWYVVQTQPNGEARAALRLEQQAFEVYSPRYLKTRRHARRIDVVKAPLFPRYIFVKFDIAVQQWRTINSTIGVTNLVGHRGQPVPVTSGVVETLRLGQAADGFFKLESSAARFRAGDAVRIRAGAFDDCLGIFEARTDSERVAILLDLLGRKVRVILGVQAIEAA